MTAHCTARNLSHNLVVASVRPQHLLQSCTLAHSLALHHLLVLSYLYWVMPFLRGVRILHTVSHFLAVCAKDTNSQCNARTQCIALSAGMCLASHGDEYSDQEVGRSGISCELNHIRHSGTAT